MEQWDIKSFLKVIDQFREEQKDPKTGKKINQDEIGIMAGLSPGIVSHWKNGRRKPDKDSIVKVCKTIGRDPADFVIKDKDETEIIKKLVKKYKNSEGDLLKDPDARRLFMGAFGYGLNIDKSKKIPAERLAIYGDWFMQLLERMLKVKKDFD